MLQTVRKVVEVVVLPELAHDTLDAADLLDLEFRTGLGRFAGRNVDCFQIQVGVGPGQAAHRDAAHGDFLHQLLVVGVESIEPVNLGVLLPVGGGIAENHQRREFLEGVHRLGAFHLLRLVEDHDGAVAGDHVDGAAGLKVVQFLINAPGILTAGVEGLDVDHHDVDAGTGREAFEIVELF